MILTLLPKPRLKPGLKPGGLKPGGLKPGSLKPGPTPTPGLAQPGKTLLCNYRSRGHHV